MSSAIEQAYWRLSGLLPKKHQSQLDQLYKEIDPSELSIEARVTLRTFDLCPHDHSDWSYGEDYEVGMTYRNHETDDDLSEHDEVEEAIEDLENRISDLEDRVSELEDEISELEDAADDDEDGVLDVKRISALNAEIVETAETRERLENERDGWKKALDEPDYDEIMWNTVWRPEGELDEDLARSLGFGVLTIISDDVPGVDHGDQFMGLQGCGMDLTPKIMAYCALKYHAIDPAWVRYLDREPEYAQYVVGKDVMGRVCSAVGVSHEDVFRGRDKEQ